jgi:Carboxypeptidase regulatory-like domain/TonB-dependent Receptor Plug Domain
VREKTFRTGREYFQRAGRLAWLGILPIVAAGHIWAGTGGSVSGLVRDPSGASVADAHVKATNIATGVTQSAGTDAAGFYSLLNLPVGEYEVVIAHVGFKEFREQHLVVNVNSALRLDASLEVGSTGESITVSGSAPQVEIISTQNGEAINSKKMTTIPLNGRSYIDLLAIQPGVVPSTTTGRGPKPVSGNLNAGDFSVSGMRESDNGYMVNGIVTKEEQRGGTAIIPNLDSIEEFRVLTNNADAEYGNFSGGQVNLVTKSGSNQFHGSAFDFLRNTDLDARNFFSPTRGTYIQNQFGGTLGGPIIHNKVFFFGDYQRLIQGAP